MNDQIKTEGEDVNPVPQGDGDSGSAPVTEPDATPADATEGDEAPE